MDCLGIFSKFLAMTTKTTAKATAKTKRMKNNPMCCHCEPVRVWQSMENKKQQQRKRLDCHDLRSRNDDKGKGKRQQQRQNGIFYGFPITAFGLMTEKEENGIFFMDCHDLRSRNDKKKWKTDLFCYGLPRQQVATE